MAVRDGHVARNGRQPRASQVLPALLQSPPMTQRLTPTAALLLVIPPLMWSGNAVVGRLVAPMVSPMTLNLLRWSIAFLLLLPLAGAVLRRDSDLWPQWHRFALLSLFSIGGYNALLYLALNTSSAINVTLVGASTLSETNGHVRPPGLVVTRWMYDVLAAMWFENDRVGNNRVPAAIHSTALTSTRRIQVQAPTIRYGNVTTHF